MDKRQVLRGGIVLAAIFAVAVFAGSGSVMAQSRSVMARSRIAPKRAPGMVWVTRAEPGWKRSPRVKAPPSDKCR